MIQTIAAVIVLLLSSLLPQPADTEGEFPFLYRCGTPDGWWVAPSPQCGPTNINDGATCYEDEDCFWSPLYCPSYFTAAVSCPAK